MIDLLQRFKPALLFQPDTIYEYSNTGYVLLATIIERVSKMSYDKFLDKYIFKPFHMDRSFVYTRRNTPLLIKDYALGYVFDSAGKKQLPDNWKTIENSEKLFRIQEDGRVTQPLLKGNLTKTKQL